MAEKQRKRAFPTNKYQKSILLLTFVPLLVVYLIIYLLSTVFHNELINVIVNKSPTVGIQFISQWYVFIIFVIAVAFTLILFWSYGVSTRLVGAFERVIREMDAVLEGKEKRHIVVRKGDDLAQDLVDRVNKLIDGYQK